MSGNWSNVNMTNSGVHDHDYTVSAVGTKIVVAGGSDYFNVRTDRIDIYDTVTGQFSLGKLSSRRISIAAFSNGNMLFLAGGITPNYTYSNVIDVYDASTNQWSQSTLPRSLQTGVGISLDTIGMVVYANYYNAVDIYHFDNAACINPIVPTGTILPPLFSSSTGQPSSASSMSPSILGLALLFVYLI